jgi:SAM-dependent methyltransferase
MKEEKTWFKTWFNTKYYHILYKDRNDNEAKKFISNLLGLLKLPPNSNCLDLACGKGRHARFLCENNLTVLGVDLSENSIKEAQKFENENLKFEVQDMRNSFRENEFDAVFNLFTSFGYFDSQQDNLKVLQAINRMLKQEGLLVIDFMNAHKVTKNLVATEIKKADDIQFNITRNYDGNHIFKNIEFDVDVEKHNYTERVQALQLKDFKLLLKETGFELLETFGNFNLEKFDLETSDRLIIIARKF